MRSVHAIAITTFLLIVGHTNAVVAQPLRSAEPRNEFETAMMHESGFNTERWAKAMMQKSKMSRYRPQVRLLDPGADVILRAAAR